MTQYFVGRVAVVVVGLSLSVMPAAGSDPPHWVGPGIQMDCSTGCHVAHQAPGDSLTGSAGNVLLCQSCHNPAGQASDRPITSADVAHPNIGGTSHAFGVPAINAECDSQMPNNTAMQLRVMDDNIVCSTCHNQHSGNAADGGTPRISQPKRITALGSTGAISSTGTYTGPEGAWYLLEIESAGNEDTASFRYSKDNGDSWEATGLTAGPAVILDCGVTVSFGTGSYQVSERWRLCGSWPFVRGAVDSGDNMAGIDFCRDCHRSWVMDHLAVETYDGTFRSHPVGVPLNANARSYDRMVPLDGNGEAQGSLGADLNRSNDLLPDEEGNVQCLTCHAVHFADNNTLTGNPP
ncbi:MAG: cytochrome c3 family protein [Acidobacteriota bacterium]